MTTEEITKEILEIKKRHGFTSKKMCYMININPNTFQNCKNPNSPTKFHLLHLINLVNAVEELYDLVYLHELKIRLKL